MKFLNLANYWDRTGSNTHEVVSYAGSAQFTVPSLIFHNLHPNAGKYRTHAPFFRDVLNLMDFLSILPLPIDIIINAIDPGVPVSKAIRLLSVFRVLRIFKVTRHFEGENMSNQFCR